ncbi:MAG: hypothetical protein ACJ79K_14360 [Gemmatimonadaceae bacterium]
MLRIVTMSRREFMRRVGSATAGAATVGVASAGAATFGFAVAGCGAGEAYDAGALARPDVLAALGAGPVRAIGARYRAMNHAEGDAASLRRAISASRPFASRFLGAASPPLAELVRADFAEGRTIVVDGWVLSATEARQCALFSLAAG